MAADIVPFTARPARAILPARRQPPPAFFGAEGLALYTSVLDQLDALMTDNPVAGLHVLEAIDRWLDPGAEGGA
jgi:hypothetical protein